MFVYIKNTQEEYWYYGKGKLLAILQFQNRKGLTDCLDEDKRF